MTRNKKTPEMSFESDESEFDGDEDENRNSDDSQEENSNDEEELLRRRGPNKGADVPENPEDRPKIIAIGNHFPDTRVTSDITMIIRSNYNGFWPTWRKVPQDIKDLFWKQFNMHFRWSAWRNAQIRRAWKKTNADRFRGLMADERSKAIAKYGPNKIAWKQYKPEWISRKLWIRLIDEVWNTKEWTGKSASAKKNRLMGKEKAEPTYTGGSIPMCAHKEKMKVELERQPTDVEVFDRTHKKDHGTGDFVGQKAKQVRENYDKTIEEKFPDEDTRPSFDPAVWNEACGGMSKQRCSGYGIVGNEHDHWMTEGGDQFDMDAYDGKMAELEQMVKDTHQQNVESLNEVRDSMKNLEAKIPKIMKRVMEEIANGYGSEDSDEVSVSEEIDSDSFDQDMNIPNKKRVYAGQNAKGGKKNKENQKKRKKPRKSTH